MLYATPEGLVKRYGEQSIKTLAISADSPKVAEALEDASQTIDSYLAGRYTLPLKSVPAVLERHCCYIARYFLEKIGQPTKHAAITMTASATSKKWPTALSPSGLVRVAKPWKATMWPLLNHKAPCGRVIKQKDLFDE